MELVQELVFPALIALFFSYFVAKLVSFAMAPAAGDDSASGSGSGSGSGSVVEELKQFDDDVTVEELQFVEKMNVGILESHNRVEFVEDETVEKVDEFQEELHQDDSSEEMIVEKEAETDDGLVVEKIATGSALDISNDVIVQSEEINVVGKESKDSLVCGDIDDDWEGIERSELEEVFARAVKFVEESGNKNDFLSDVQMELYALHKIATEGPCHEPQPMPLMLTSRSKWNAWQKLGNMNPEEAMELYVALLSDRVPGWKKENYPVDDKLESEEIGKPDAVAPPDTSSFTGDQKDYTHERNLELKSGSEGSDLTGASSFETGAKE